MMYNKQNFKLSGVTLVLLILLTIPPASASDWSSITVLNSITGKVAYPGDIVEFDITVQKGYNITQESWCALSISSKPDGWTAGFYNDGDQVTHVTFPQDQNSPEAVTLRVKIPASAPNGGYSVWADFKQDEGKLISREFSITVDDLAGPNLDIYSDVPGLETRPSDPVEFGVTLQNKYDHRVTVDLTAAGKPEGWNVEFLHEDDGKYRVTRVSIAANDKQDFIVKVRPSINAEDGTYPIVVNAAVENGVTAVEQRLDVKINRGIEESKMLSIFPGTRDITLNPGASREIMIDLRNSGDRTLNNVEVRVQDVSGISTSVRSFGAIDELEPGESRTIPVSISARADASPGEKEILMRAVSNEAQSEDQRVTVTVKKSSSSGFIGIMLVILAGAALVFIISKFGRR